VTRIAASWAVAALAALLAISLLLPGLGRAPFDDPGEGQQAEIAREAWVSGDLFDLRLNGVRYFDKPPLLYWMIALDFRLWGPSEWAARLPSVAGAAAAAAATAYLGARLFGPGTGVLASAALLSCALFAVYGRYVRPETLFAAAIQIGLTGLLLWFPTFFTHLLPGWLLNVATIVHSDEALLAVGFIFTVHFFNTHFRPEKFPMDTVIFTGTVPLEEFKKDRPREYEALVASGKLEQHLVPPPDPTKVAAWRIFGWIALTLGILMVGLILYAAVFGYR